MNDPVQVVQTFLVTNEDTLVKKVREVVENVNYLFIQDLSVLVENNFNFLNINRNISIVRADVNEVNNEKTVVDNIIFAKALNYIIENGILVLVQKIVKEIIGHTYFEENALNTVLNERVVVIFEVVFGSEEVKGIGVVAVDDSKRVKNIENIEEDMSVLGKKRGIIKSRSLGLN